MPTTTHLTPDELLTTTRAVRRKLDLLRPVDPDLIAACLAVTQQAPSGGNQQDWGFVVITEPATKAALAGLYRRARDETSPKLTDEETAAFLAALPAAERAGFVADLARVGRRHLLLAMPCGRLARLSERLLDGWYALRGISTPPWLIEHMHEGLPDRAEVEAAVAGLGRPYRVYGNENVLAHLLVMMAESSDLLRPRLLRQTRERMDRVAWLAARFNMRPTYRLLFVVDLQGTLSP